MKPWHQTKFGYPDGNCFATCVACLLEIPVPEVPNFCGGSNPAWLDDAREFVANRSNFSLLMILGSPTMEVVAAELECYSIVGGPSPRGSFDHSVIFLGSRMVHDPHPDGTGIAGVPNDWLFFVARDPAFSSSAGSTPAVGRPELAAGRG